MAAFDPREVVARGYDLAARDYERWLDESVVDLARVEYLERFCALVPEGERVIELGCGGGGPTTQALAARYALTGVDISASQLALARERLPGATFVQADMTRFEVPPGSLGGVFACYSLIHLPYGELPLFLTRMTSWLRPGGLFVANLSGRDEDSEHLEPSWLGGAPMYWSGYTVADNLRFIEDAGLAILEANIEQVTEDGEELPSLWIVARKPGG